MPYRKYSYDKFSLALGLSQRQIPYVDSVIWCTYKSENGGRKIVLQKYASVKIFSAVVLLVNETWYNNPLRSVWRILGMSHWPLIM